MAIGPDKIELRVTAPEVKEVMTTPATSMAQAAESLVGLLQKINDLGDARKAILHAKDLYNSGDTAKAKDLAMGIFQRLQQIGRAPEGLDVGTVQEQLRLGKYGELATSMKKAKDQGEAKSEKTPEDLIVRLGKVERNKPLDQAQQDKNKLINEALVKDINAEVVGKKKIVDQREVDVQKEFTGLLSLIEKKASATEIVELEELRTNIESRTIGEVDTKAQILKLKTKITDKVRERVNGGQLVGAKEKAKVASNVKSGNVTGALGSLAERVKQSKRGEQIFISRLEKLQKGMDKVNLGVEKGIGLREAVRNLHIDEIREVRTLLASLGEIKEVGDRSPYYDETYVNFIAGLGLDGQEIVGLQKMLETVDIHYQQEALKREVVGPEIVGQKNSINIGKSPRRRESRGEPRVEEEFIDFEQVKDAEGKPVHGMKGFLTEEQAKAAFEYGKEEFDNLFVELPDGHFRQINYEEQLSNKIDRNNMDLREHKYATLEQRESFLNINMKNLFKDIQDYDDQYLVEHPEFAKDGAKEGEYVSLWEMIDEQHYLDKGVAKLKDEYMKPSEKNQKHKDRFEAWWYQETSFAQRGLAYEGLFDRRNQSPRMQKLNSLMEIIGIDTTKKGLANWMSMSYGTVDQQNNSYVNAEFMQKLATFWTNQGVDFRLENMLKENREEISIMGRNGERIKMLDKDGNAVSTSVFDSISFLQKDVPADHPLRKELGIPEWWKGKWGTLVYKYSNKEVRGNVRRRVWDSFLSEELGLRPGDTKSTHNKVEDFDNISNQYQVMFDLAFQYSVVHKQLYQMLGNASFKQGEFELPAACAEMHLKLDPVLYSKAFVPRYTWLNVAFKEGWALFDPGVRDYITMAPQDYASHFTIFDEKDPNALETDNGSPTILKTFLLGEDKRGASSADIAAATELKGIFNKALWHWGAGKSRHEALGFMMEWGVDGEQKSAYRRSAGEVSAMLIKNKPSQSTLDAMKWDEYYKIAKDPKIERRMREAKSSEAKWNIFAETFGEHSFNHSTPSAKRSGDHPVKYGVEDFNKYVETFSAWIADPYNQEKFDALLDTPTKVNAGAANGIAKKNLDFLILMSERMGRRELGGGKMKRIYRNPKDGTTKFDTSKGIHGAGDNEWPAFLTEEITNSKLPWSPIQHKSIPESVGVGVPVDKQILLDLIKGQRAKNRLPDEMYSHFYKEIVNSVWWEKELGIPINIYKLLTLEPLLEWIAPSLGITGHELKHILEENTEKTAEKFLHYLNGGSGGGH